jgi:putative hydrolase
MLKNSGIAELLALEVDGATGHLQKALRRASRLAFMWPVEAAVLLQQERSLTELPGVGPHLERIIRAWVQNPPKPRPPDPLRAGFITLVDARAVLSRHPEWAKQLRGDLQMHTHYSDGSGTVQDMANEAELRGYNFIAITDHSKGLSIANGMDERRLRRQGQEIESVNAMLAERGAKVRVLKAIEMNLNPRGEGDMESNALSELDLVLGSFHSALRKMEDQTSRYLAGLRNPDIQVLGHPRGRVYNYRAGLNADWPRVFAEAAALDKAVEIDSYVDRQDLSIELLSVAREAGVRISIGTDAHSPDQLAFIELGLATALLAKIPAERIINFLPREQLLGWSARIKHDVTRSRSKRTMQSREGEPASVDGENMEVDDAGGSMTKRGGRKTKTAARSGPEEKRERKRHLPM